MSMERLSGFTATTLIGDQLRAMDQPRVVALPW